MEVLSIIYWTRVALGVLAAMISVVLNIQDIYSGISLAIILYLITNYVLKWRYNAKIQNSSKILRTGIGAYFLSWVVMWILFYSLVS